MTELPNKEGTAVKEYSHPLSAKAPELPSRKMPLVHLVMPFVYNPVVWEDPYFQKYANAVTNDETETGKLDYDHYEAYKLVWAQIEKEEKTYLFRGNLPAKIVSAVIRACNANRKAIAQQAPQEQAV
jgi:hypothetical protein